MGRLGERPETPFMNPGHPPGELGRQVSPAEMNVQEGGLNTPMPRK